MEQGNQTEQAQVQEQAQEQETKPRRTRQAKSNPTEHSEAESKPKSKSKLKPKRTKPITPNEIEQEEQSYNSVGNKPLIIVLTIVVWIAVFGVKQAIMGGWPFESTTEQSSTIGYEDSNLTISKNNPYSWIYGRWRCETSLGTMYLVIHPESILQINSFGTDSATYYIENNEIHAHFSQDPNYVTTIFQLNGNRIGAGGGYWFYKYAEL